MKVIRIGLVSNGLGNVGSVESALAFYKYDVLRVEAASDLEKVDCIVLGGVGHFGTAVGRLKEMRLWDALQRDIADKRKPTLGLCLGMQLLFESSEEALNREATGNATGFGLIPGAVVKLPESQGCVPHIGWNIVQQDVAHPESAELFRGLRYNNFYYMHSYHCVPTDPNTIAASTPFGEVSITAVVAWRNMVGLQFHPEKSQGDGLRLIRNVLDQFRCRDFG